MIVRRMPPQVTGKLYKTAIRPAILCGTVVVNVRLLKFTYPQNKCCRDTNTKTDMPSYKIGKIKIGPHLPEGASSMHYG